jgi:hypothetical protein
MKQGSDGNSIALASCGDMHVKSFHAIGKNRYAGREVICSVTAPIGTNNFFKVLEIDLLPSATILWPKCNSIAIDFDKWRVRNRLVFSKEATGLTDAVCILVFNPDPRLSMPSSLNQAQEFDCFKFDSVRKNFILDISKHKNMVNWYSTIVAGEVRDYCPGKVGIYLQGIDSQASGATLGYVFHEYIIEFQDAIPPQSSSIEFGPIAGPDLARTGCAASQISGLGNVPLIMPPPNSSPTIFNSKNWEHSETFNLLKLTQGGVGSIWVPMLTNNASATGSGYAPADSSTVYCGSGSVWRVPSGGTVPYQVEVSGQVGGTVYWATSVNQASLDVGIRLELMYQKPEDEAIGAITGAATLTSVYVINTSGTSGNFSWPLTEFYHYIVPSTPIKAWFEAYIYIGTSSATDATARLVVSNASYFDAEITPQGTIEPLSFLPPSTTYDLQSGQSLWKPLFDAGAQGQVLIWDEEDKKEIDDEINDFSSRLKPEQAKTFELMLRKMQSMFASAKKGDTITIKAVEANERSEDDQKRPVSPLSHDTLSEDYQEAVAAIALAEHMQKYTGQQAAIFTARASDELTKKFPELKGTSREKRSL